MIIHSRSGAKRIGAALVASLLTIGGLTSGVSISQATTWETPLFLSTVGGATGGDLSEDNVLYAYVDSNANGGSLDVTGYHRDRLDGKADITQLTIKIIDPNGAKQQFDFPLANGKKVTELTGMTGFTAEVAGVWTIAISSVCADCGSNASLLELNILPFKEKELKSGRVWANRNLRMEQRPGVTSDSQSPSSLSAVPVDVKIWTLSQYGIQHQVTQRAFQGFSNEFYVNNLGLVDSKCSPIYHSANIPEPGISLASTDCPGFQEYRMFFEEPDESMPSGTVPSADGPTWVFARYGDNLPELTISMPNYVAGVVPAPGKLEVLNSGKQSGTVTLYLDANGDDTVTEPADRKLGESKLNPAEILKLDWDGLDGEGKELPATGWVLRSFLTGVGEVHWAISDAEYRAGGMSVKQLVGPNEGNSKVSWNDDATLGGLYEGDTPKCLSYQGGSDINYTTCLANSPLPSVMKATDVESSEGTAHGWGYQNSSSGDVAASRTWGDGRWIDDWQTDRIEVTQDWFPHKVEIPEPEPTAELSIKKDDGRISVEPGQELTYTITVENLGEAVDSINISDLLPPNTEFVSASKPGLPNGKNNKIIWQETGEPGIFDETTNQVNWLQQSFDLGASLAYQVTVWVAADAKDGDTIDNYARVFLENETPPECGPSRVSVKGCAVDKDLVELLVKPKETLAAPPAPQTKQPSARVQAGGQPVTDSWPMGVAALAIAVALGLGILGYTGWRQGSASVMRRNINH